MNKIEQIEEMAVELSEGGCANCSECSYEDRFNCKLLYDAELLYKAGYRRQIKGRWIGRPLCGNASARCSVCGAWWNIHVNLSSKVMQKYCPSCGAYMEDDEH